MGLLDKVKSDNTKAYDMYKPLEDFHKQIANEKTLDSTFARPDDVDLTEDEIKEINAYWGKYKFAYPQIDYESFKTFKNRSGKFDVRHCPGPVRRFFFRKHFLNPSYQTAWQNKAMLQILFPNVAQPVTIVRRMAGIYYDRRYNPMSLDRAIDIMLEKAYEGTEIIVKPTNMGGGKGIFFVNKNSSYKSVKANIENLGGRAFVAQEVIEQSDFMRAFNGSSVNTVRITTLLHKDKVHVLAALVRTGQEGSRVDNFSQGGSIIGVDIKSGKCNDWALTHDNDHITVLPSGLDLKAEPLIVPNFDKIKATVEKLHYIIPYIKLISWDIALDKNNTPTLIENNFAGMIQMHEAVTGPIFGELMDELLDTYVLEKFFVSFRTNEWVCDEYSDHIVLSSYVGTSKKVTVPAKIKDKKVTMIKSTAFSKSVKVDKIVVPKTIAQRSSAALKKIADVKTV